MCRNPNVTILLIAQYFALSHNQPIEVRYAGKAAFIQNTRDKRQENIRIREEIVRLYIAVYC